MKPCFENKCHKNDQQKWIQHGKIGPKLAKLDQRWPTLDEEWAKLNQI